MARTHRAHLSKRKLAERGGIPEKRVRAVTKTTKQQRPRERVALRREYL